MVGAGKAGARESDKGQLGIGRLMPGHFERTLHRSTFGHRHGGLTLVGRQHAAELVMLPVFDHQISPGVDHAGGTHHKQPDQGHDAQEIVQIQPFHTRLAIAAHCPEVQLAHEGSVKNHSADNRYQQQQSHQAQEELAGKTCKQVHMELEHDPHEALIETGLGQQLGSAGIDDHRAEVIGWRRGRRHGDEPEIVGFIGLGRELHHAIRILGAGNIQYLVQAGMRRALGHGGSFDLGAQQVSDFMVKDQGQAGEAQQQHEHGADQAAPFVHPGPDLDGVALHLIRSNG